MGKNFIGCSNYPNCTNTYSVPQNAKIVATGKMCELCHTPKIKVFRKGKRPFEMDLDPNCESKKDWAKPGEQNPQAKKASELKMQPAATQNTAAQKSMSVSSFFVKSSSSMSGQYVDRALYMLRPNSVTSMLAPFM